MHRIKSQWTRAQSILTLMLMFWGSLAEALEINTPHTFEGKAQGTSYHVRYVGKEVPRLPEEVESFLRDFDKTFSNYRPDSEVSRFNREAKEGVWFPVSRELFQLIKLAMELSEKSQGRFDITLGALLELWGFGPYKKAKAVQDIPSEAALEQARQRSGYQKLKLSSEPRALIKTVSGLEIDLSGIAQGYAVDRLGALLEARGIENYLVEIGGEIKSKGQKAPGLDWQVSIDSPAGVQTGGAIVIKLRDQALATSGSYRNYFEKKGKRYAHILNPLSGQATEGELASASVLAKTAAEADAWAKVLMILGPGGARAWAEKTGLPSFIIVPSGSSFRSESLAGFQRFHAHAAQP